MVDLVKLSGTEMRPVAKIIEKSTYIKLNMYYIYIALPCRTTLFGCRGEANPSASKNHFGSTR